MRGAAALLLAAGLAAGPCTYANAEQLVSTVSNPSIAITSSFNGETLTFFGTIEPDPGATQRLSGPYDVVIVVIGPSSDRVARLKTNELGIWINTQQVVFKTFPTYYQVLASGPLDRITDRATLDAAAILPEAQPAKSAPSDTPGTREFGAELVRLMEQRGLFGVDEAAVKFLSNTTYSARLDLPGNIQSGLFIAQTYVFKDGLLIAKAGESFSISTTGFERLVGATARENPLVYGLVSVVLALGTGWLAGVAFKR